MVTREENRGDDGGGAGSGDGACTLEEGGKQSVTMVTKLCV